MAYLIILAFSVISLVGNEAARILVVIPTPSISHQFVFRPLTEELAKIGHEVILMTTDPAFPKGQAPANLTEIDLHDMSYEIWRNEFVAQDKGNPNEHTDQMRVIFGLLTVVFEKQLQAPEFQEILNKGPNYFDLLLLEGCVPATLSLSHIFKAPVIQVSSFGRTYGNYEAIGAPTDPLIYPTFVRQRIYNLTPWEKMVQVYKHYAMLNMARGLNQEIDGMFKRQFGPDFPTLWELNNNVDMLFLNIHPIWEGNHPVPPSVIYMWGLHQKPDKELPKDLKTYLESSEDGVIYVSFGTNTNSSLLPPEKIQLFVKVLSQLPYNVLWKWDGDMLPGHPKNIRISKWFPQSDLLKHPKIKLFITQGGLQSTDEAITAGVPLVGIPMLGDQWYNVEKYVHHKIGKKLDLGSLTEEQFRDAVVTVIEDESFRRNIVKLRELMKDQPMRPLERAIWWIEHVLRHGGARHLRAPAANMSWREYLELEVVITLVLLLVAFISLAAIIIYKSFKFISSPLKSNIKQKVN